MKPSLRPNNPVTFPLFKMARVKVHGKVWERLSANEFSVMLKIGGK